MLRRRVWVEQSHDCPQGAKAAQTELASEDFLGLEFPMSLDGTTSFQIVYVHGTWILNVANIYAIPVNFCPHCGVKLE